MAKSVFVNQNFKVNLKKSISNHLLLHGKKSKCEAFFLKAVKLVQKSSIKSSQLIVKLSIVNSLSIINVKKLVKKKGKQKKYPAGKPECSMPGYPWAEMVGEYKIMLAHKVELFYEIT